MAIVVAGYSGCAIVVRSAKPEAAEEAGCTYVLEKTSSSASYNPRLHRQIDKQDQYRQRLEALAHQNADGAMIVVPRVLFRHETRRHTGDVGPLVVGMVFEHHVDCLTFMAKSPINDVKSLLRTLVRVVESHVALSPLAHVPSETISLKLHDVIRVVRGNSRLNDVADEIVEVVTSLRQWIDTSPSHEMPVGTCHGDLTLSNILVQLNSMVDGVRVLRVVLIDFLDSFVETPLADLAKLSQDLVYGWTLRMAPSTSGLDRVRLYIAFADARDQLQAAFGGHAWYQRYFRFFFVVNQLRVLQYSKSQDDTEYLLRSVREQFAVWKREHSENIS
jgi:hypothetical protein